jgi:elongation factor 1 alpha-like protein
LNPGTPSFELNCEKKRYSELYAPLFVGLGIDDMAVQVAFAGDQVSVTLAGVDMQNVAVGYILCDPMHPIPVTSHFEARIVVFNIKVPITRGYSVSLLD